MTLTGYICRCGSTYASPLTLRQSPCCRWPLALVVFPLVLAFSRKED